VNVFFSILQKPSLSKARLALTFFHLATFFLCRFQPFFVFLFNSEPKTVTYFFYIKGEQRDERSIYNGFRFFFLNFMLTKQNSPQKSLLFSD